MCLDKAIRFILFGLAACLLSSDFTGGLSFHLFTAPVATICLLGVLTSFLPKIPRAVIQLLLGEIIILLCLVDAYCQTYFESPINPQLFSVIINTDAREASEFFATFVSVKSLLKWRILLLVLLALLLPISYLKKIDGCFNRLKLNRLTGIIITFVILVCVMIEIKPFYRYTQLFGSKVDIQETEGLMFRQYHREMTTPMHRVILAYHSSQQSKKALAGIRNSTLSAKIDGCTRKSPHIVLIVGESYNKHHSSLYGYRLATAPLQQKRADDGELFVFKDVVTPWNITSNALLNIFSLWESDSETKIADYPLFPGLFRQAGYSVNFYSNQMILRGFGKGITNQSGSYFLADVQLSDAMFDYRNRHKSQYDMGLVNMVANNNADSCRVEYTFDIIHLMGQHFEYEKRYPQDYSQFTDNEYLDRDISDDAKQVVKHYDNATYYNDKVLDEILSLYENEDAIVVFVSDHGEEVFDNLQVSGRLYQEPTLAQAQQEFEIPMWIWCSESYRRNHEDVLKNIENSVEKPFITDGIPQILLYLADISSEWNDDSHNLLSNDYQCHKRIIAGCVNYDELK